MQHLDQITTVYELIEQAAAVGGDSTAITFLEAITPEIRDSRTSYTELLAAVNRSARLARSHLDDRSGVVSLLLPNIPQTQAILWGAESVAIANPVNPLLSETALAGLLATAGTEVIFALGPNPVIDIWEKVQAVAPKLPRLKQIYSVVFPDPGGTRPHYDQAVLEQDAGGLPDAWRPRPDDVAAYFHTGGTTGIPKLALHTHKNQVTTGCNRARYSGNAAGDVVINGLPLFHVAGSTVSSLGTLAAIGNMLLPTLGGFRNPEVISHCWRLVEHYRIAFTGGIPTSVAAMMQVPVGDADISSLKMVAAGGSPVPLSLIDAVQAVTGLPIHQMYGMTETAGLITVPNAAVTPVRGSVGWVPPVTEIRIDGAAGQPGEVGEIYVRGPQVFGGYLGSQPSPLDARGWLHSGDLGYLDKHGHLFLTGRAKDLIIRSGHNIDPAVIEHCAEQHPAVSLAAAVGKPDAYAGELPVLYVQLNSDRQVDADTLQAFIAERIEEPPACPKQVTIMEALPVTAVGKIHKPSLRAMAAESAVLENLRRDFPDLELSAAGDQTERGELRVTVTVPLASLEAVAAAAEAVATRMNLLVTAVVAS
ncbi:AMP-binding protein [Exilibacterium tricleocarpae]|uniref:AMP-binding protein n=1 Tax=Exilibacterium tricleocarpae TaxID=2591008 RepID=A0A545SSN8_9GAMM|nr:AMP-binding protein [Exilibacterium tricleocarpae]TQV67989.1 AMP-binding protein [Exilibacterium tricleocarpae]